MGTLPAHPLLETFSFYMDQAQEDAWHALVHVCQRWRYVVLGSPRRLNLRLLCTRRSPVRRMLDIWPPLPLVISDPCLTTIWRRKHGASDMVAALGHKDRIVEITLCYVPSWIWQNLLDAMQESLPALTNLSLGSNMSPSPLLPASFLGGSAPLLRSLFLSSVAYPELPLLLSSARDLVVLQVLYIPDTWYISPEEMVACLSSLTRLTTLDLGFESEMDIHPVQVTPRSSRQKRTVLLSLSCFHFRGTSKYLEDLVSQIDAPRLSNVVATFVKPIVSADISQLSQFIGQVDNFQLLNQADIVIPDDPVVKLRLNVGGAFGVWCELIIPCPPGWYGPLWTLAQVCVNNIRSSPPSSLPLSTLEHLTICGYRDWWPTWGSRWLEILPAFTAVKNLYLREEIARHLLPVLEGVTGESTTEVLPALQNLFLTEYYAPPKPAKEVIQQLTTVRQLAGRPIAVRRWNR
jgi:hypothetical protein